MLRMGDPILAKWLNLNSKLGLTKACSLTVSWDLEPGSTAARSLRPFEPIQLEPGVTFSLVQRNTQSVDSRSVREKWQAAACSQAGSSLPFLHCNLQAPGNPFDPKVTGNWEGFLLQLFEEVRIVEVALPLQNDQMDEGLPSMCLRELDVA